MKRTTTIGLITGICIGATGGVFAGLKAGPFFIPKSVGQFRIEAEDLIIRTEQLGSRISRIEGKKLYIWSGEDASCTSPPIINNEPCPFREKVCPYALKNGLDGLRLIADSYSAGKFDGMIIIEPKCHPAPKLKTDN
jgi:hypothetical protein